MFEILVFMMKTTLEHPEIQVSKKDDSPDEDKSLADSKALLPTLQDFFEKHPLIKPSVFLGDSAFDSIDIYKELLGEDGLLAKHLYRFPGVS
jgi:hypothetical protein